MAVFRRIKRAVMLCFVYKSLKKDGLYLDKKENFSSLPEALLKHVGRMEFVMELELTAERKLARENSEKVLFSFI